MFDRVLNTLNLPMITSQQLSISNNANQEPMLLQTLIFNTIKSNNALNILPLYLFSKTADKHQKKIC